MSRFKSFLLGVVKIAAAILLVVIGVIMLVWGVQQYRAAENAPLAQPREWPSIRVEALENAQLKVSTMWRDERLYYQFSVNGYPKAVQVARDSGTSGVTGFTLTFQDANGFKLLEQVVPLSGIAKVIDGKGEGAGLDAKGDTYLDATTYRRFALWNVTWNFDIIRDLTDEERKKMTAAVADEERKRLEAGSSSGDVVESQIDGEFGGFQGNTIVKLANAQVWQQTSNERDYTNFFQPATGLKVLIIKSPDGYQMQVAGVPTAVTVRRLK